MDRIGADFFNSLDMIIQKLGANPIAIQLPWGNEENFKGVIDLIKKKAIVWHDDTLGITFDLLIYPRN